MNRAGGDTILTTIAGVGDLIFLADPTGNVARAMGYDDTAD